MILELNNLITVELSSGIESTDDIPLAVDYCSYFTTEMTPMYASVFDVRRYVGAFVTEIPDDVINQLILEWSITAQDIAVSMCDDESKWLRYANKWVTYRVSLIILYNTEEFRGISGDKLFKQLGDFSVSKGGGSSSGTSGIDSMIDWLECEAFKYEFSIRNCTAPAMNCLGLEDNDAMPYFPRASKLVEKGLYDKNKPMVGRRWMTTVKGIPRGNNTIDYYNRRYHTNIGTTRDMP